MAKRAAGFWSLEIFEGFDIVFCRRLPGNLTSSEIATILQRIASRTLTRDEIIAASVRKPKTTLLEYRVDGPPQGIRTMVWLPALSDYRASYWRADEPNAPEEISLVDER